MIVPQEAVEAAARYVSRSVYGQDGGPDVEDLQHGRELARILAPYLVQAERSRVRSLIDPRKLELLAAALDRESDLKGTPRQEREVPGDLRLWAMVLRGGEPGPASITDMLIDAAESVGAVEGP